MDRNLYTFAAHANLDFANPISPKTIDQALSLLSLPTPARVIDIGCGKGELSVRIARRWGIGAAERCVDAVDSSALMIDELRRRAAASGAEVAARINAVRADAGAFTTAASAGSYDGAVCFGSSHALGGAIPALAAVARLLKPGGEALIGEGVWEREPSPDYLRASGMAREEMPTLSEWTAAAASAGLFARWIVTASSREWDEYEWAHARGIDGFADANPGRPEAAAMLTRSRAWRQTYLAWGRGTLGFALGVLKRRLV
jgi:SAM-dependent methyltransferase